MKQSIILCAALAFTVIGALKLGATSSDVILRHLAPGDGVKFSVEHAELQFEGEWDEIYDGPAGAVYAPGESASVYASFSSGARMRVIPTKAHRLRNQGAAWEVAPKAQMGFLEEEGDEIEERHLGEGSGMALRQEDHTLHFKGAWLPVTPADLPERAGEWYEPQDGAYIDWTDDKTGKLVRLHFPPGHVAIDYGALWVLTRRPGTRAGGKHAGPPPRHRCTQFCEESTLVTWDADCWEDGYLPPGYELWFWCSGEGEAGCDVTASGATCDPPASGGTLAYHWDCNGLNYFWLNNDGEFCLHEDH